MAVYLKYTPDRDGSNRTYINAAKDKDGDARNDKS